MADMENNNSEKKTAPKTRTLGYLPMEVIKTFKSWPAHKEASGEYSKIKAKAEKTKKAVKEEMKTRGGYKADTDLDFSEDGDRVRIFEHLQKKEGGRSIDLSDRFR